MNRLSVLIAIFLLTFISVLGCVTERSTAELQSDGLSPSSPDYYATSEYMIGSVAVGIIFPESNGEIDPDTENWVSSEKSQVVNEIKTALDWWARQNPSAHVSFTYTIHYGVPTGYEPITHRSYLDQHLWIAEIMETLGYPGSFYWIQVLDYVNTLRRDLDTDWAFAIFVVDSSNDADGCFADGWYAYSYLGGPFMVLTSDIHYWGINRMDRVCAHELGHIFYATDEWNGRSERSGYLYVADVEGSGNLMDDCSWRLSSGTKGQVGWRDSDRDGILDIVDTFPETCLFSMFQGAKINASALTYYGAASVVPYPRRDHSSTRSDCTINTITQVEYRVDSGMWLDAIATDGNFDDAQENFTFTIANLPSGPHTLEVRAINSVGNVEVSYTCDTVTVGSSDLTPPIWRNLEQNTSDPVQGAAIAMACQGFDANGLRYAILATNETGPWRACTILGVAMPGGQWVWSNFTWSNPSLPVGTTVGWRIHYLDVAGNLNTTRIQTFTIVAETKEADLLLDLIEAYGSSLGDSRYTLRCDFDGDGDVDSTDVFSYFARNYWN